MRTFRRSASLDRATGLPVRREQTVEFPGGEMKVVEITQVVIIE